MRTYAPRGQTPTLKVPLTRDHLSAISALTTDGRLFCQVQTRAFTGPDVVRFLKHLLRHVPGKLVILWDGAPIHRSQVVKDFLAQGGAQRIHLVSLPGYAPDLNPDEGVWRYLKRVEMGNRWCDDLPDLTREVRRATARLRQKPHILKSCIRHAGYPL